MKRYKNGSAPKVGDVFRDQGGKEFTCVALDVDGDPVDEGKTPRRAEACVLIHRSTIHQSTERMARDAPCKIWVASGEKLHNIIGVSGSKAVAERFAKRRGEWGGDGDVREYWAIPCGTGPECNEVFLLGPVRDEAEPKRYLIGVDLIEEEKALKASALAKLTPAERRALGLD